MGNNIGKLIKSSKKKLTEISDSTGISYSTLGNYNQGTRTPKKENAKILADYFGVSIPYLLGLDDNPVLKYPEASGLIQQLNQIQLKKRQLLDQYIVLDLQEKDILQKIKEIHHYDY